ncbi:DUF349 domain-containing protein [Kaarinaea lacus]
MVFEKFFPPRWKHKNPQIRKRALLMLDPSKEESQKIFMEVLGKDPELFIRRVAIKGLTNINQLQNLRENSEQSEIYQEATNRLCELLATCNKHRPISYLKNALSGISENRILEFVALHANDEELQLSAMDKVANESILFEILDSTKFANNKKHALVKLQSANSLKRAIKILRRKDKELAAQAQAKLDNLQEKSKQSAELKKEYKRTANEFLGLFNLCKFSGEWGKYETRLRELNDRCQGLLTRLGDIHAESDVNILQEVKDAFRQFEDHLREINASESLRPDWGASAAIEESEPRPVEFDQLLKNCDELREINSKITQIKPAEWHSVEEDYQQVLSRLRDDWDKTISKINASNLTQDYQSELENLKASFISEEKRFETSLAQIGEAASYISSIDQLNVRANSQIESEDLLDPGQVNKLLKSYQAKKRPENPYIPDEIDLRKREIIEALKQKQKRIELYLDEISEEFSLLTARLEQALADGKAKSVEQMINRGRNILKQLPKKYLSRLDEKNLPKTFSQLVRRADSLLEWRQWSTSTVKEQLINDMEKLAIEINEHSSDDDYDFAGAAAEISQARARWKQAARGTKDKDVSMWEKFDQACNKAYEPCQAYFNQLDEERNKNLEQREKICHDLEQYFSGVTEQEPEHINWKALEKITRVAREDWGKLGNVSRNDRGVINKRFHGVLHKLEKLARNRRDENKAAKQTLIKRIETTLKQLEEQTMKLEDGVDLVKKSQAEWKGIGPASKDQQLWKKFKSVCDSVFAIKKTEQDKVKQEEANVSKQRDEIINSISRHAELEGDEIFQARAQVDKLQSEWRELPKLNKGHKQERRLNGVLEKFSKALRRVQQGQFREVKQQVQKNVACCYQLEALIDDCLQGRVTSDGLKDSVQNISEKWKTVNEKSLSFTAAIEERFDHLKKYAADLANGKKKEFEQTLSEQHEIRLSNKENLCIHLEILAGKESPEKSKQKRMEIQVARLADTMRQTGKPDIEGETQQLLSQWHTSGFILPPESNQFEQRFYSALELLDKDYQYPL